MSERYLKLFSLEENLYIPGSPVLIAAGALLKDTQTGKILGQLKLQSISDQPIKAATVELIPLDTVGNPLGEPVSYQYLDLEITRDAYWGSQDPIRFYDPSTRAYTASVKEVIFSDNSIWTAPNSAWKALPAKTTLETQLDDFELATQYRMHFGMDCQYGYQTVEDLWYCPCGAINHQGESVCHACQKDRNELGVDWDLLRKEAAERVAQKRAEEEALAAERERKLAEKKAKQEEYKERIRNLPQSCLFHLKTLLRNRLFRRIAVFALILVVAIFAGVKALNCHQVQERKQAYMVFCDYIRENGIEDGEYLVSLKFDLSSGYGEWKSYQDPSSEPKILCTFNQFVGGDLTAVLDPGSNTVSLELTTSPAESDSYASAFNYDIPYDFPKNWVISAKFDVDSYSEGKAILPDEWSDASGEHSFSADSWEKNFGMMMAFDFLEMLSCLDESLQEYGLGISVADLGFTSY